MPEAPSGVIAGGWSYVVAAYSVTAVTLAAYVWSLRRRRVEGDDEPPRREEGR